MKRKTNDEFISELAALNNGITSLDQYVNNKVKIRFMCKNGHIWYATPMSILKGHGCPYCDGKIPIIGQTDLWTTRPDVAKMLKNTDDGYKYSCGSHKKVSFICPNCGAELHKEVKSVCQQGIGCTYCSDNISYPNKFIRCVLEYTDATNIIPEWSPEWIGRYRYDVYFKIDDAQYVIEMDGGLGHGNRDIKCTDGMPSLDVDVFKDKAANRHGINVIRIDCDYGPVNNRFCYIKNHIIESKLSCIVDLKNVNWNECNTNSMMSYVPMVAKMFNDGCSIEEISASCGYCGRTVRQWLYRAEGVGLCDCSLIRGTKRGTKPYKVMVNQYSLDGEYIATFDSITKASAATGIPGENICACYKHKYQHAGGYVWFEVSDPTQPDKSKVFHNNTKLIKEVI